MIRNTGCGGLVERAVAHGMGEAVADEAIAGAVPLVRVAHKTGNMTGVRHDVGLVYAYDQVYVLCPLGSDIGDTRRYAQPTDGYRV